MTTNIPVHPDDERELFHLRRNLIGWRVIQGLTREDVATRMGLSKYGLHEAESGSNGSTRLSRLQRWAAAMDLRIEIKLDWLPGPGGIDWEGRDLPVFAAMDDPEVEAMWTMAQRTFDAHQWQRMWIVAALTELRKQEGLTGIQMGERLGITGGAVSLREKHHGEPLIQSLMQYARALGIRLHLEAMERPDWERYRRLMTAE